MPGGGRQVEPGLAPAEFGEQAGDVGLVPRPVASEHIGVDNHGGGGHKPAEPTGLPGANGGGGPAPAVHSAVVDVGAPPSA